jgi:hypothetical protein
MSGPSQELRPFGTSLISSMLNQMKTGIIYSGPRLLKPGLPGVLRHSIKLQTLPQDTSLIECQE